MDLSVSTVQRALWKSVWPSSVKMSQVIVYKILVYSVQWCKSVVTFQIPGYPCVFSRGLVEQYAHGYFSLA